MRVRVEDEVRGGRGRGGSGEAERVYRGRGRGRRSVVHCQPHAGARTQVGAGVRVAVAPVSAAMPAVASTIALASRVRPRTVRERDQFFPNGPGWRVFAASDRANSQLYAGARAFRAPNDRRANPASAIDSDNKPRYKARAALLLSAPVVSASRAVLGTSVGGRVGGGAGGAGGAGGGAGARAGGKRVGREGKTGRSAASSTRYIIECGGVQRPPFPVASPQPASQPVLLALVVISGRSPACLPAEQ